MLTIYTMKDGKKTASVKLNKRGPVDLENMGADEMEFFTNYSNGKLKRITPGAYLVKEYDAADYMAADKLWPTLNMVKEKTKRHSYTAREIKEFSKIYSDFTSGKIDGVKFVLLNIAAALKSLRSGEMK